MGAEIVSCDLKCLFDTLSYARVEKYLDHVLIAQEFRNLSRRVMSLTLCK